MIISKGEHLEGPALVQNLSYIYAIRFDCFREYIYGCGGNGLLFRYDMSLLKLERFEGTDTEIWNFALDEDNDRMFSIDYSGYCSVWNTSTRLRMG